MLVGVEIVSGLVQADALKRATGDNAVKALQGWFGTFPKPQEIQSDNRSHFTARGVQPWAKGEGIKRSFHTPFHYPQAKGILERTKRFLKGLLKPREGNWDVRLWEAVKRVNSRWGVNGCPKITAFCPTAPSIIPLLRRPDDSKSPAHYPGQPVLVDLPTVGEVALVLKTPLKKYAWVASDALGKEHWINTCWIILSILTLFCPSVEGFLLFLL